MHLHNGRILVRCSLMFTKRILILCPPSRWFMPPLIMILTLKNSSLPWIMGRQLSLLMQFTLHRPEWWVWERSVLFSWWINDSLESSVTCLNHKFFVRVMGMSCWSRFLDKWKGGLCLWWLNYPPSQLIWVYQRCQIKCPFYYKPVISMLAFLGWLHFF